MLAYRVTICGLYMDAMGPVHIACVAVSDMHSTSHRCFLYPESIVNTSHTCADNSTSGHMEQVKSYLYTNKNRQHTNKKHYVYNKPCPYNTIALGSSWSLVEVGFITLLVELSIHLSPAAGCVVWGVIVDSSQGVKSQVSFADITLHYFGQGKTRRLLFCRTDHEKGHNMPCSARPIASVF